MVSGFRAFGIAEVRVFMLQVLGASAVRLRGFSGLRFRVGAWSYQDEACIWNPCVILSLMIPAVRSPRWLLYIIPTALLGPPIIPIQP